MEEMLKPIMSQIISTKQDGFVEGRQIIDGIIQVHEVIHSMHNKKTPTMVMKLDMEKAYDRVSWFFLDMVLVKFGFHEVWRKWIMECISTPMLSISINGEVT